MEGPRAAATSSCRVSSIASCQGEGNNEGNNEGKKSSPEVKALGRKGAMEQRVRVAQGQPKGLSRPWDDRKGEESGLGLGGVSSTTEGESRTRGGCTRRGWG